MADQTDLDKFLSSIGVGLGAPGTLPKNSNENSQTSTTGTTSGLSTTQQFINALTQAFSQNQGSSSQTSTPNLTPGLQGLMDQLTSKFGQIANPNTSHIEATGLKKINANSNAQSDVVNNIMASRGLSTSPVAATAEANVQNQRFGNINDFQTQLPSIIQGLQTGGAQAAQSFLQGAPVGSTTTGSSSQSGTSGNTSSTDTQGNTITTGSSAGQTDVNKQNTSGGGASGVLGGLGAFLAKLFG